MSDSGTQPKTSRRRRVIRRATVILASLAAVLFSARLALPTIVEHYVNKQLSQMKDYSGSIGKVRIHLWRGAYAIHDIRIAKADGKVDQPLFAARLMDLSVQWKELFHGAIVCEALLQEPVVNFVQGETSQESQSGVEESWTKTLDSLVPFQINRFEITNGRVHFQNTQKSRPVDVYLTNVWAVATNLSNSRDLRQRLPAGLQATGLSLGNGQLRVDLHMNPQDSDPTFELNASITNLDLPALNDFLRGYAKLDVARGTLSLFASLACVRGEYNGYVKVLCNNLQVFSWEKERKKNVLEIVWQAIAGTLAAGFKNHPHDQLAAQIPITGKFAETHINTWATVGSLLQNAFIAALRPRIEPLIHLDDVKKED